MESTGAGLIALGIVYVEPMREDSCSEHSRADGFRLFAERSCCVAPGRKSTLVELRATVCYLRHFKQSYQYQYCVGTVHVQYQQGNSKIWIRVNSVRAGNPPTHGGIKLQCRSSELGKYEQWLKVRDVKK